MNAVDSELPPQFEFAKLDPDIAKLFATEGAKLAEMALEACLSGGFEPKDAQYLLYSAIFLRLLPSRNPHQHLEDQIINAMKSELDVWVDRRARR